MAVRMYASGGLLCQLVAPHQVMSIPYALHRWSRGLPICIGIDHLFAMRLVLDAAAAYPLRWQVSLRPSPEWKKEMERDGL